MTINMLLCAATGRAAIIAGKVRLTPESGRHLVALGMSLPSHKRIFVGTFDSMRDGLNRRLQFLLIASLRWFGLFSRRKCILRFFRRTKASFIGAGPEESGQCLFLSLI